MSFWQIAEFCDQDCWLFEPDTGDNYSIVEVRADADPARSDTAITSRNIEIFERHFERDRWNYLVGARLAGAYLQRFATGAASEP